MKKNKLRKAIFAVVYSVNKNGKVEYLILKRKKHWKGWEFTKGKIEKFEGKKKTVRREVFEETGLRILKIKNHKIKGQYKYNKKLNDRPGVVGQTYNLFSVKVDKGNGKIKVDSIEHYSGKWASFKEAYKMLTWTNQRKCLRIVNDFLEKNKR